MRLPIDIDGSRGEGGGQILRTALALSIVTGRKLRMKRIRAGRKHPGLQRQHLACVDAAAKLCGAKLALPELGAQELVFAPGREVLPGHRILGAQPAKPLVMLAALESIHVQQIELGRCRHRVRPSSRGWRRPCVPETVSHASRPQ